MAVCHNCHQQFNGTPWTYDPTTEARIHVNCALPPPPKPNLGPSGAGSTALPPAPISAVQHLMKPHRSQHDNARPRRKPKSKARQRKASQAQTKNRTKHATRIVITAKYDSLCGHCARTIAAGEKIMNGPEGWAHISCTRTDAT